MGTDGRRHCDGGFGQAAFIFGAFKALRAVRKGPPGTPVRGPSVQSGFLSIGASRLVSSGCCCIACSNWQHADRRQCPHRRDAHGLLLTAQWRFVTERHWMNHRASGKNNLDNIVAVAAAGYLTMAAVHQGVEAYWLWRAGNRKSFPLTKSSPI